jgi:chemotaxis signal transduction protein
MLMGDCYLLHYDDLLVAVAKQGVELLAAGNEVHVLPFLPAGVAGVLMAGDRQTPLFDLAGLLSRRPYEPHAPGHIFLVTGGAHEGGFIIAADLAPQVVTPVAIRPLPAALARPGLEKAVLLADGRAVVLLDLARLHRHLPADRASQAQAPSPPPLAPATGAALRLFTVTGQVFAVADGGQARLVPRPPELSLLPGAPASVAGLAALASELVVVVDPALGLGLTRPDRPELLLCQGNVGLLIDEDLGVLDSAQGQRFSLPPLLECPWFSALVSRQGSLVPVLEVEGLFAESRPPSLAGRYQPASPFAEQFGAEEVEVQEFMLLGGCHAVPKVEVAEVVEMLPLLPLPGLHSLAMGAVEYGGEVVAVLDLARVFARRSLPGGKWQLLLLENGDFRAFVLTERVLSRRALELDRQHQVPIATSRSLLYGCYPDEEAVRLILNVESLAVHFDRLVVQEFIPSLTPEMATAPAEIIAELLTDQTPAAPQPEDTAPLIEQGRDQGAAEGGSEPAVVQPDRPEPGLPPAAPEDSEQVAEDSEQAAEDSEQDAEDSDQDAEDSEQVAEDSGQGAKDSDQAAEDSGQDAKDSDQAAEDTGLAAEATARLAAEQCHQAEELARCLAEQGVQATELRARQALAEVHQQPVAAQARQAAGEAHNRATLATAQEKEHQQQVAARLRQPTPWRTFPRDLGQLSRRQGARQRRHWWALGLLLLAALLFYGLQGDHNGSPARQAVLPQSPARVASQTAPPLEQAVPQAPTPEAEAVIIPGDQIPEAPARPEMATLGQDSPLAPPGAAEAPHAVEAGPVQEETPLPPAAATGEVAALVPPAQDTAGPTRVEPDSGPVQPVATMTETPEALETLETAAGDQEEAAHHLPEAAALLPVAEEGAAVDEPLPAPIIMTVPADVPILRGTYRVKKGDTLWDISDQLTGDPYNFVEMARENKIKNPDLIFPAQEIRLQRGEPDENAQ